MGLFRRGAVGVRRLIERSDLRFPCREEELAFASHLGKSGFQHLALSALMTLLALSWKEWMYINRERQAEVQLDSLFQPDARLVPLVSSSTCAAWCLVLAVYSVYRLWLQRRGDRRSAPHMETLVLAHYFGVLAAIIASRRRNYVAFIQDHAWERRLVGDDAIFLLGLDVLVTILCFSGVARTHRLVLPVFSSLVLWAVVSCGSPSMRGGELGVMVLLILDLFALIGAYRNERFMRREWLQRGKIEAQAAELNMQSALAIGMQTGAENFCDFVMRVSADFQVCSQDLAVDDFFGCPMLGRDLDEVMEPEEWQRLLFALRQSSETQIPQCLPVTFRIRNGSKEREAQVLITDTGTSKPKHIIGVSCSGEEARTESDGARLRNEVSDALDDFDTPLPERSEFRGSELGTTYTGALFTGQSLDSIAALGRQERWWVEQEELRVPVPIEILGVGSFGVVGAMIFHGQTVAVKTMHGSGKETGGKVAAFLNELRLLRHLRHPNIVSLYGAHVDAETYTIALVYELIRGMELGRLINKAPPPPLGRFQILLDISSALRYLHYQPRPIVHGDLKGSNVMIEETRSGYRTKLIDFGLSRFWRKCSQTSGGTLAWCAPEFFSQTELSTAVDTFAFGWLVQLTMTGKGPYGGITGDALMDAVESAACRRTLPAVVLPADTPWLQQCNSLCSACLQFEAKSRPSIPQVQDSLRSWLSTEDICSLGKHAATALMKHVDWRSGLAELHLAPSLAQQEAQAQVDLNVAQSFRVLWSGVVAGPDDGMELPGVGEDFLSWLEDGLEGFRISIATTMNDIQRGAKAVPHVKWLSSVVVRAPQQEGHRRSSRVAIVAAFFPDDTGRVSFRLTPLLDQQHTPCWHPARSSSCSVSTDPKEASACGYEVGDGGAVPPGGFLRL